MYKNSTPMIKDALLMSLDVLPWSTDALCLRIVPYVLNDLPVSMDPPPPSIDILPVSMNDLPLPIDILSMSKSAFSYIHRHSPICVKLFFLSCGCSFPRTLRPEWYHASPIQHLRRAANTGRGNKKASTASACKTAKIHWDRAGGILKAKTMSTHFVL